MRRPCRTAFILALESGHQLVVSFANEAVVDAEIVGFYRLIYPLKRRGSSLGPGILWAHQSKYVVYIYWIIIRQTKLTNRGATSGPFFSLRIRDVRHIYVPEIHILLRTIPGVSQLTGYLLWRIFFLCVRSLWRCGALHRSSRHVWMGSAFRVRYVRTGTFWCHRGYVLLSGGAFFHLCVTILHVACPVTTDVMKVTS